MLACHQNLEVAGSQAGQPRGDRRPRQFRGVTIPAQVPQVDSAESRRQKVGRGGGRGIIAQMPVTALDPLFEAPRAPGIISNGYLGMPEKTLKIWAGVT